MSDHHRDRYLSNIPPTGRALSLEEQQAMMADMQTIVNSSFLFKSLDDEGREKIFRSGYVCSFPEGFVIMRQTEPGDTMYLVLNGKVVVETGGVGGGSLTLAQLGRGACFGEVAVLTGKPRTATVSALEETSCVAFAAHRIDRVLKEYPEIHRLLLSLIESRAKATVEKLIASTGSVPPPAKDS
ncbi:MAG: cyclic nucleotide-binding domain-containing protein [Myxococcales bacterium]|nr:MAG: cyclic nucleotide-binding domain-containing protein [Myxococcales bacterium]